MAIEAVLVSLDTGCVVLIWSSVAFCYIACLILSTCGVYGPGKMG